MLNPESLKTILPPTVYTSVICNLDEAQLQEIRVRAGMPVCVTYRGREYCLTRGGVSDDPSLALFATAEDVKGIVVAASEHSVYAYNDDINRGFITVSGGVRIGVCGETVYDRGSLVTVKNYSSVNIRIPHEITGCSSNIMSDIVANHCKALIVSPPGAGKTTMLRDIARSLSDDSPHFNVLIADERCELACVSGGVPGMNVGMRTDVISGSTKAHAFECAVRSMRPDVIITDEIFGQADIEIIREAIGCGISVIASAHADGPETLMRRRFIREAAEERLFERYYFLSGDFGDGHIAAVCDAGLTSADV